MYLCSPLDGPFVYRLGRQVFILERGVRLPYGLQNTSRDGAVVARRAHNPKVTGSSPVPATKEEKSSIMATFFVLRLSKTEVDNEDIGKGVYN